MQSLYTLDISVHQISFRDIRWLMFLLIEITFQYYLSQTEGPSQYTKGYTFTDNHLQGNMKSSTKISLIKINNGLFYVSNQGGI